jgi:hypothetical protein
MAAMCSNRHFCRGFCNRSELQSARPRGPHIARFLQRPEANVVNLSTKKTNCGPQVSHCHRKIVTAPFRRLFHARFEERLIKPGLRASKIA